jgi:hypothetical protein
MNPNMLMYMQQQPQASHRGAPEETAATPFSAGALAAIKSAKQSLGMDEEEQRRAMGLSIAKFFSGMAQPGYGPGIEGTLGAAASNIAPALEAYQGEENRVAGLNSALLKQHTDYGIEQQKMRQQAAERALMQAHRDAKQTETQRHNQAMERKNDALLQMKAVTAGMKGSKLQKDAEKQERIEKLLSECEIPIETLEPSARADVQKKAHKANEDVPVNERALKNIEKMRAIFKVYPDIGSSFLQVLDTSPLKAPGLMTQLARKFADPKKVAAIQKLKKYADDLNLQTILDAPGKTATNIFKESVARASPNGILDERAFNDISASWEDKIHTNLEKAKIYKESLKKRVVPDFSRIKERMSSTTDEDINAQKAALDEEITALAEQIKQMKGASAQEGMIP